MGIASVLVVTLLFLALPEVYAEDENDFFSSIQNWFASLFGGEPEPAPSMVEKTVEPKQTSSMVEKTVEPTPQLELTKKAVIIDQLYDEFPNEFFHKHAVDYLNQGGYDVDVVTTKDITVDFYKKLPSMNYEYIVMRTHSMVIYGDNPSSWIFTGEKYTESKYIQDQLSGHLSPGVPFLIRAAEDMGLEEARKHRLFMIGDKLINDLMVGEFPNSVVLIGGCDSLSHTFLADAFMGRGASAVLGWDGLVDLQNNDTVILRFLKDVMIDNKLVEEAVSDVMGDYNNKLYYTSRLHTVSSGASGTG